MSDINALIEEIKNIYMGQDLTPFPYTDLAELKRQFEDDFIKLHPSNSISADLNSYWMTIAGLASGGIANKLSDAMELYYLYLKLSKSFFEMYPQYRFMERYNLAEYTVLSYNFKLYDKLRVMLIKVIKTYEGKNS